MSLEQHSKAWLKWRDAGTGSSDAIVIAAHYGLIERTTWMDSLDDLFNEKMTGISRTVENDRMRRGTEYEAEARMVFEKLTGTLVQPLCAEMLIEPRIRASFDGISFDQLMINEIKVPHEKVVDAARDGKIIEYYLPQVAHQGLVAWGHPDTWVKDQIIMFYAYDPDTKSGGLVRMPALELRDFALKLYEHELEFLAMLDRKEPPCGFAYFAEAKAYGELDQRIKALEGERDLLKLRLIMLAEDQGLDAIEGGGVRTSEATRSGTVNWKKLAGEYSISDDEQNKYRGKDSKYWVVKADPKMFAKVVPGDSDAVKDQGSKPERMTEAEKAEAFVEDPCWGRIALQADGKTSAPATEPAH